MSKLIFDNKPLEPEPGLTLLRTALANDLYVPSLCFHPDLPPAEDNLVITVRDERNRLAFGSESDEETVEEVAQRIPFVYSDWKMALASRFDTPEQLAKSNFVLNVSLIADARVQIGVAYVGR